MQESVLTDEITADLVAHLTPNEKEEHIQLLEESVEELENGIGNEKSFVFKMAMGSQKDFFGMWASNLEQLVFLGKFDKEVNEISTHIRRQLGKLDLSIDTKENLYNNLDRNLDSRFKKTRNPNPQIEDNNTSAISEGDFMRFSLKQLQIYHLKFAKLADTLFNHLADPKIHKDYSDVIEWKEIALFSAALADLTKINKETGILDQIEDELNIRESATIFQKAMLYLLNADHSFRKMAHKFGVSPRQNQRIRKRMEDWGKKDPAKVIQNVVSSYQCMKCGFNPVTQRTYDDVKMFQESTWLKIKYGDKFFPIPEKYKRLALSPIQIAEKIWGKKIRLG